ncbi:ZIP zinc transporter-domain-containing protein [Panaeolus papilionaceus]|nr:ZIP zinc transporter-domain-containing protein [Panaeolus papilionaceus]
MSRRLSWLLPSVALLSLLILKSQAIQSNGKETVVETLSIFEEHIQECEPIKQLGHLKETLEAQHSPIMRTVFAWLFPFGPAWNSILGTFYISSVPNFILAFIPAEINGDTLNTMTAFATGGLLSDVFLHLVPHAFMGEHQGDGVQFVMVEEKRNILVGLGIFIGFATFFFMEKSLRVLGSDSESEGIGHSHSHSHSHSASTVTKASGTEKKSATQRKGTKNGVAEEEVAANDTNGNSAGPSKMSAYLNLFGDFVHNITDGLAIAPITGLKTFLWILWGSSSLPAKRGRNPDCHVPAIWLNALSEFAAHQKPTCTDLSCGC